MGSEQMGIINLSEDGDPRFDFNTGWIFKRYGDKGVPFGDLEEAIYDGVSEAFVRLEPGREETFCGYAVGFVKKQICRRFRDLHRRPILFSDFAELIAAEDEPVEARVEEITYSRGAEKLFDAQMVARFVEQLADLFVMLFPDEDTELIERGVSDPSVNHYRRVPVERYAARLLTLRHVDGLKLDEIAARMGFRNDAWASHYCRRAYHALLKRCRRPEVRDMIAVDGVVD